MNNKRDYTIESITDYIKALKEIKDVEKNELWFRGHNKASWYLVPTLYREDRCFETTDRYGTPISPKAKTFQLKGQEVRFPDQFLMLESFKEGIVENNLNPSYPMNDIEWLCFAQHYGVPTSLLDWSEDPMVGLFFAVDGITVINDGEDLNDEARIYVLNPSVYNEKYCNLRIVTEDGKTKGASEPFIITDDNYQVFVDYIKNDYNLPVCIKPNKIGYRMCRQSGNFMLFSSQIQPLDTYSSSAINEFMYTIHIPYKVITNFTSYLDVLNLNKSSIYGDNAPLDDIGQKVKEDGDRQIKAIVDTIKNSFMK